MNRAEIIKFLLDKSNINISELTRKMGVHRTNVYHWRDGITAPKKSTINKLSEILNIPIKWEGKDQVSIINAPIELIEEKIDMNMDSSKIISLYDENRELRLKLERLKAQSLNASQNMVYPEVFEDMASMVESAQNTWNWTFLNSPTPMSIANNRGIITSVNLSLVKQLGYRHPDEMKNKSILDFVHPDDKKRVMEALSKDNRDLNCKILKANDKYCEIHIIAKTFKAEFGDSFSVAQMNCINSCEDIDK